MTAQEFENSVNLFFKGQHKDYFRRFAETHADLVMSELAWMELLIRTWKVYRG